MADPRAQQMRRHATKAEWQLWRELRHYRAQGFVLRRQAPLDKYILDFVSHRERLVIEIDGDQHGLPACRAYDEERTRFLESRGYRVMRFDNHEILANLAGVVDGIDTVLKERSRLKFDAAVPPPEPISRLPRNTVRPPRSGGGNN